MGKHFLQLLAAPALAGLFCLLPVSNAQSQGSRNQFESQESLKDSAHLITQPSLVLPLIVSGASGGGIVLLLQFLKQFIAKPRQRDRASRENSIALATDDTLKDTDHIDQQNHKALDRAGASAGDLTGVTSKKQRKRPVSKVRLEQFTVFDRLELEFVPGINVLVGPNGVGKTHLMKVCYAACDFYKAGDSLSRTGTSFVKKLVRVFMPSGMALGRLVKRRQGTGTAVVEVHADGDNRKLKIDFASNGSKPKAQGVDRWDRIESVYIPVKEMLANAPGFLSLYQARKIRFEEVYADILQRANLPVRRGRHDQLTKDLLGKLEEAIQGQVVVADEEFFLRNEQGNLEFTLLAEGMRKMGLLILLIKNKVLPSGSVLFWDEPETNLNPELYGTLIEVLLKLQRTGVQIILATHDYLILSELDIRMQDSDSVAFHSLYQDQQGKISCNSANSYLHIKPNAIADA